MESTTAAPQNRREVQPNASSQKKASNEAPFADIEEVQLGQENSMQGLSDGVSYELNRCLEVIGLGCYQYKMFILCGVGWMADGLWFQVIGMS